MTPQILYLVMWAFGLGIVISHHGEPRDEEYNFFLSLAVSLVILGLLFWGGFFDPFFS